MWGRGREQSNYEFATIMKFEVAKFVAMKFVVKLKKFIIAQFVITNFLKVCFDNR